MKWRIAISTLLAVLPVTRAWAAEQPPSPGRDLGADVRRIFVAKCAACHGPELAKPKGRFGYVLDLKKVASNPEMVVPSRPDESELWVLIGRDEMPPSDSPHGPLSAAEKETVRAWIAAGSPDAKEPNTTDPNARDTPTPSSPSAPTTDRAIHWFGKFHLLALHFPIALVIAAGIGEFVPMLRGSRDASPAVQFCLLLAACAVVPTVTLGWLHAAAGNGIGSPLLLTTHRWLGTIAGVWVIGTAWVAHRDARRRSAIRAALVMGIVMIVATAHFGGLMAHGSDFFAR